MTEYIQVLMAIATLVVSIFAIVLSVKIAKDSNKITLVAQKRADRLEKLRNYSAAILASAECAAYNENINVVSTCKVELIKNVRLFISQLQYVYPRDIQLIDDALIIKETALSTCERSDIDKLLTNFWKEVDLYVGTEYERLKKESNGELEKSGAVNESISTFEGIYESLEVASSQFNDVKKY